MTSDTAHRILVVDDEPDMVRGIRRILDIEGYDVQVAGSGDAAIQQARKWQPHGVLMDLKMPGMNGVEAYRQIRDVCPNAFVIFMTAYSSMVGEAREEGAVDVLTKPLDPAALCELIAKALTTRLVLIVDDDADFRKSLSRVLKARKCQVQTASSAEQALALYEKQPRSVVLLDMRLGETNGLELLRMLKQRNSAALVIQMSGDAGMQDSMQQGLELSATASVNKPFDVDLVLEKIDQAIQSEN